MVADPNHKAHASPSAGDLTLGTVTTGAGLAALAGQWDDLVRAMPRPSPFLLHGWVSAWHAHCAADRPLAVATAHRDGELVGAVPLYVRSARGLRVASFLGDDNSALADVLLAPGEGDDTLRRLVDHAVAGEHSALDVFGLPGASRLERALGPERIRVVERVEAPVMDAPEGWEAAYREKTGSKQRNQHKRRRRQLSELGAYEVTVARTADELEAAMPDVFRLHTARWQGRPDGSGLQSAAGQAFARDAALALARDDVPRIVFLRLDGRPIAFFYYLALGGTMYLYRLSFDPEYARYSPGLVNALDALEVACDEGLTRIEFLGGNERYKMQLADRTEPMHQGMAASGGLAGRAYVSGRMAAIDVRQRLKRNERLRGIYYDRLGPLRTALGRRERDSE
jgi:CelD/BcsL family acetyltransferase involved in cellulose biosynthesis